MAGVHGEPYFTVHNLSGAISVANGVNSIIIGEQFRADMNILSGQSAQIAQRLVIAFFPFFSAATSHDGIGAVHRMRRGHPTGLTLQRRQASAIDSSTKKTRLN